MSIDANLQLTDTERRALLIITANAISATIAGGIAL
jgi:hypothetical protein